MEPEERQLVDEARRGQHAAFRKLVEKYQKKVFALALSHLRDQEQARDVTQDAFVKAYDHLADFQGDSSFYTWIYRIALNLCIDRARRLKRFSQVEYDEAVDVDSTDAAGISPDRLGFDPAQALADREIRERVMEALGRLSANHRTVIVLRELEGLSYKEIASVMGCSTGTVMSRLFHARKRMQEMLRPLVAGEEPAASVGG